MRSYTSFCYICLSFNQIISPDSENKILIDQAKERMSIGEYFYAHLFVLFAISCKPTDSSSEVLKEWLVILISQDLRSPVLLFY